MSSEPVPQVDEGEYRRAVSRFATGVTVVTTRVGHLDHAMTANAICSVSLDPLLMLVSVEREARFHDAIIDAGVWGVSVLPASARGTAQWLATRGRPLHGQLDRVPHHQGEATGVPLLSEALAHLELRTVQTHLAGDHTLVVGNVVSVQISEHPGDALIYYRGRFGALP
ncbi:flavin reductase family protein [Luteipulveratus sp. YIM 133132]|uniref:Flavin reductase family protein n=1 Tax=Luteipulveratus flavus TaxID=3031728 RepID=A0ABT6C7S0_9MICO|nr:MULTISPECIES: flavin reductase family protein [unclassified Luteipulveratus]MDE9365788.1 flavin reductase family protein [Luteipulveratus sp. YIM 133132]MDF8264978.1 flavin reductase family protein [Luteipulveratus sp. YIM 133296]